jgi:hypothetical protein
MKWNFVSGNKLSLILHLRNTTGLIRDAVTFFQHKIVRGDFTGATNF